MFSRRPCLHQFDRSAQDFAGVDRFDDFAARSSAFECVTKFCVNTSIDVVSVSKYRSAFYPDRGKGTLGKRIHVSLIDDVTKVKVP